MTNAGNWTVLTNGDKLWTMEISSPNALSINLLYDKFWLPEGTSLFLYSKDKKQYMGGFTSITRPMPQRALKPRWYYTIRMVTIRMWR